MWICICGNYVYFKFGHIQHKQSEIWTLVVNVRQQQTDKCITNVYNVRPIYLLSFKPSSCQSVLFGFCSSFYWIYYCMQSNVIPLICLSLMGFKCLINLFCIKQWFVFCNSRYVEKISSVFGSKTWSVSLNFF